MLPSFFLARNSRAAVWLLCAGAALAVSAMGPPVPASMAPAAATGTPGPVLDLASVPPLQLLTSPPPPSPGAAAEPVPSGEPDSPRAALHRAYRLDLVNLELKPPVFLNENAASIIAGDLHLGVAILVVAHGASHQGRPVLALGAQINEKKEDPSSPYLLLCDGGHFSLLLPSEAPSERHGYYLLDEGVYKSYAEAAVDPGESGAPRRIPADGNCLITSLHFLKHGRFPDPAEIARLRGLVAASLTGEQVADALEAMRSDLVLHAAETPFEGGTYPGYGPLTSSWLRDSDPEFMAKRHQVLEAHCQEAAEAEIQLAREHAKRSAEVGAAAAAKLARKREDRELPAKQLAMVEAYRSCLLEAVPSITLGPELVHELAAELGDMYVPIARVIPGVMEGRPLIRVTERVNAGDPDQNEAFCLLFHDGHCQVLERLPEAGTHKDAMFYSDENEVRGHLVLSFPGRERVGLATIPADGNSLFNAIFAMQEEEFPTASELARLKSGLNRRLTSSRVLKLLEQRRADLSADAFEQLCAASGFLESKGEPGEGKAATARRPFREEEEDTDLALALALSLAPPDTGGGGGASSPDGIRPRKLPRT